MAVAIVLALASALGFGSSSLFARLATQRLTVPVTTLLVAATGALIATASAFIFNFGDIWKLHVLPDFPLVLLSKVAALHEVSDKPHPQQNAG